MNDLRESLLNIRQYVDRINIELVMVLAGLVLFWGLVLFGLFGCACPEQAYKPVPAWLVPTQPTVPTVKGDELTCLSDATYTRLAERDKACWQYARELRALLDGT